MSMAKQHTAGALGVLLDTIGKLAGVRLDPQEIEAGQMSAEQLQKLRHEEALAAALEIRAGIEQARADLIGELRRSGRIKAAWTFETLSRDRSNAEALALATGFAAAGGTPVEGEPLLLLLSGAAGSGKTVIAHAVANAWLEAAGKAVLITDMNRLRRLRIFNQKEDWQSVHERREQWECCLKADLLIVDSLCANCEGLSVYDQKVFTELVRARRDAELALMITTPVPLDLLHSSIGESCFESLREYSVMGGTLLGGSRRNPIVVNGKRI